MAINIEVKHRLRELEERINAFAQQNKDVDVAALIAGAERRITELENKYRMLNARLNKKNNKDGDDRDRDPGGT